MDEIAIKIEHVSKEYRLVQSAAVRCAAIFKAGWPA